MRAAAALSIVLSLAGAPAAAQEPIEVDRLPIDLKRIQRELEQAQDVEDRDGLNLRYTIQIYGAAPPLQIFTEEANLVNGPVPYGAPTHQEIINHITPKEYRAPAADFSALLRWLAERSRKRNP